jgi:hypothetical protein
MALVLFSISSWPALGPFNSSMINCDYGSILAASHTSSNLICDCSVGSLFEETIRIYFTLLQIVTSCSKICRFTNYSTDYMDVHFLSHVDELLFWSPEQGRQPLTPAVSTTTMTPRSILQHTQGWRAADARIIAAIPRQTTECPFFFRPASNVQLFSKHRPKLLKYHVSSTCSDTGVQESEDLQGGGRPDTPRTFHGYGQCNTRQVLCAAAAIYLGGRCCGNITLSQGAVCFWIYANIIRNCLRIMTCSTYLALSSTYRM